MDVVDGLDEFGNVEPEKAPRANALESIHLGEGVAICDSLLDSIRQCSYS